MQVQRNDAMKYKEKSDARIVYMGTPSISAKVLEALVLDDWNVVGVISNEDKATGRKHLLEPTPTKAVALRYGIPVFQPHRIRLDHGFLAPLEPDVIVCFAYGQIVPQEVLDAPKRGCINLHGSLLPKLRGAAPIQRAIMTGEKETGVTLMQMVSAMDAGVMYDKEIVAIDPKDNYTTLSEKISEAGQTLILKDLLPYLNAELPGIPQDEKKVTFAAKISPEDEHIPLSQSVDGFVRYCHGISETPGGYLLLDGKKLKIFDCEKANGDIGSPLGCIVKDRKELLVQGQDGQIRLLDVQLEGKKRMDAKSFLNGERGLLSKVLA